MTLVRIALDAPGPAGNVRATGGIYATPLRRRTVGDAIVLPVAFYSPLASGVTTVELAPNGPDWCWKIEEMTAAQHTRYVTVPASGTTLGYEDLVDVDPATLDPAAEPEAAWTVALGDLDERVEALEQAPPAASGRFVLVTAEDKPRPDNDFTQPVLWFDFRADRTIPLANMGPYDAAVGAPVEEEEPPPSETFSVFGATAPTGSWTLGTDGTPNITFARGFYKFDSSDPTNGLPTARVVGGRAWLPAAGTMPTEATFTLYGPDANLTTAAVQTKVVTIPADSESSWIEATFDTPQDMGADGDVWLIGVRFTGGADAGKYVFGTATRPGSAAVISASGKNFAWAEQSGALAALSSQFRIGSDAPVTPAEQTHSYGVDILVDAGA